MEEVDMGTKDNNEDMYERNLESFRAEGTETSSQLGKKRSTNANSTTEYPSSDLSKPRNPSPTKRSRSAKEPIADGESVSSNPGGGDAQGATKNTETANRAAAPTGVPSTTMIAPEAGGSDVSANVDSEQSEQMRLEERRAYNRRNAARSRQRVKDQLRDLQQQVMKQSTTTQELERANVRLVAENSVLRDEVNKLRSIISGAPLLGQQPQPQTLQPFLQQLPFNASAAPLSAQAGAHSTLQIPNPYMVQNPNLQQQAQLHSSLLPHTASFPQAAPSQPSSSITPSDSGTDINQQSQMMQLLLQHLINGGGANNPMFPGQEQLQLAAIQQQQQQIHQQQQQQQDQQASLAAFMALLSGKGNTGPLHQQPGMSQALGEQAYAHPGAMVSTQSLPQTADPTSTQPQLPNLKPDKKYDTSSSREDDSESDRNYDEED
jgi:hypothetical protein